MLQALRVSEALQRGWISDCVTFGDRRLKQGDGCD